MTSTMDAFMMKTQRTLTVTRSLAAAETARVMMSLAVDLLTVTRVS